MAIVKVMFRKESANAIQYVFGHAQPGDPVDSEYCPPNADGATEEFRLGREQHHFKEGRNEAVHIIQSWSEEESKKLTPETVNTMGRALVADYFKGHQFVVVTHTDTGKLHNHIVVNSVNLETGKMVENKFKHLHELRKINDRICLERGLSVPNHDANQRKLRVPLTVQNMVRAGQKSWVFDTINKADVARSLATSYDQYVNYMDAMGIHARVEEKNITYFYPGRNRGKRGDMLGKDYDKPGLEKQFKANDERFRARPDLREKLLSAQHGLSPATLKSALETSAEPKNYSHFTKQSRRSSVPVPASERELTSQIISADEFRKARCSILNYCKENRIPLDRNPQGQTVLKGKNHVVIQEYEALNTRNGTRANLIDFVAAHHRVTLLQAVAKINGTQEPLLMEKHFGAVDRKYTSFYIPKQEQMLFAQSVEKLSGFLKSNHASPRAAEPLLTKSRAMVSKVGSIRFFGESGEGGAWEYHQGKDGAWNEKKQGVFLKPFLKHAARGTQLFIYTHPKHYLSAQGNNVFRERNQRDGILVLMEPNAHLIEHYLLENKGVRKVHVITPKGQELFKANLDFFNVLKQKLHSNKLEFKMESVDRVKSHDHSGMSL